MEYLLGTWKSAAATAYAGGWEEARAGALEVLESLGDMAELMGVQGMNFQGTDSDLPPLPTTTLTPNGSMGWGT
ncbi:WXG100 family type VII secretion target [Nocardia sp. NPDC001965]